MTRTTPSPLRDFVTDDVRPNRLVEVSWLTDYLAAGAPHGEPIMLSLGESWARTPPALLEALRRVPDTMHGYLISMYGLPRLRRVLRDYVRTTQRLPPDGHWETAVSWGGTRSVMRDFTDYVRGSRQAGATALCVAPSWDYAGFLEPQGFEVSYVPAVASEGFRPAPEAIARHAAGLRQLDLVVINAQHNPTGVVWDRPTVESLLGVALERRAAVLIDDAYFGFCDPEDEPTSAVRILLDLLDGRPSPVPWLATRSLGKQFRCNGWGLGAITAEPELLEVIVNEFRPRHSFNYGAAHQWAMAEWLEDRDAVASYLAEQRHELRRKQRALLDVVRSADPLRPVVCGPAAPYLLYPVSEVSDVSRVDDYLHRAVSEAGVMLSNAWTLARAADAPDIGYVRMYLGPDLPVLQEACDRLVKAGLLDGPSPI